MLSTSHVVIAAIATADCFLLLYLISQLKITFIAVIDSRIIFGVKRRLRLLKNVIFITSFLFVLDDVFDNGAVSRVRHAPLKCDLSAPDLDHLEVVGWIGYLLDQNLSVHDGFAIGVAGDALEQTDVEARYHLAVEFGDNPIVKLSFA